jgi:hypothetical protein
MVQKTPLSPPFGGENGSRYGPYIEDGVEDEKLMLYWGGAGVDTVSGLRVGNCVGVMEFVQVGSLVSFSGVQVGGVGFYSLMDPTTCQGESTQGRRYTLKKQFPWFS